MEANTEKFDFAIIGSGMGGLCSALILAKHGYKVAVLEKNPQIGGALQVFSRDKRIFDTGVHYVGSLDPGENLYKMFQYLGISDQLKMKKLDEHCFDLIRTSDGKGYKLGQGYDNFIAGLVMEFPEEEQAIRAFCATIQEICSHFPLYNLSTTKSESYFNTPELLAQSAWNYVNSLTQNQRLVHVLLGSGPLYAGEREHTPLHMVALIMNSYIKGSYRFVDGGSQIAKALTKNLHALGSTVLRRKEVVRANYDESGSIESVVCKDGSVFCADKFISNLHPVETMRIFGESHFRRLYRERISKLKNTVGTFSIYISLKKDSFPYLNYNVYDYFTDDVWDTVDYGNEDWPQVTFFSTPISSKSGEYADAVCIMCYMKYDEVRQWENTYNTTAEPQDRGSEYDQFKERKINQVLDKLEQRFPGLRASIREVYSSTPLTYKDYLANPEGSLYGIMKDFNNPLGTAINTKTKIPNLYLTGQNVILHGILGSTVSAFVTCFNFVDYDKTVADINAAT